MNREAVASSSIKSIGHDGVHMEVEFHNGKIYRYPDFPAEAHAQFVGAESVGRHFNQEIRGKYSHTVVLDEPDQSDKID